MNIYTRFLLSCIAGVLVPFSVLPQANMPLSAEAERCTPSFSSTEESPFSSQPGSHILPLRTPSYLPDYAAAAQQTPTQLSLPVENILQLPELPNGCEGTCLTIVLQYLGFDVDKRNISLQYVPTGSFILDAMGRRSAPHPDAAYAGQADGYGFYCFAQPVATAANRYFSEQTAPYTAYAHQGADETTLLYILNKGFPVIVWKTLYNTPPATDRTLGWYLPNGEFYIPYTNLHASVLCGYDEENFYFCDPLGLFSAIPRGIFMENFTAMGSRAVVFEGSLPTSTFL